MTGEPVRPWKSMADEGVLPHRRRPFDGNGGQHLPRIGGVELEPRDLADANAIEQHR